MIAKYEKEHSLAEEKPERPTSKSPKPDKSNKNARQNKGKDDPEVVVSRPIKEKSKSQIDDERLDTRFEIIKRTTIDNEVVFKVIDGNSKKEQFITRKELLKDDPVALCLFYEKHIVN